MLAAYCPVKDALVCVCVCVCVLWVYVCADVGIKSSCSFLSKTR